MHGVPFPQQTTVFGKPADWKDEDCYGLPVQARIQPQDIESFNDAYHWGALIKFKSGEILMTRYTADQVEETLAKYWQKFNEQMKKTAVPSIFLQ